jgi:glycosyltransferase involved in cell wall biosynthesis
MSVVIPTHGRRELLARTLRSLDRQRSAPPFEVIIVDDGADPGLGEHVPGLGLAIRPLVVHHERERGRAATRNSGLARASGEVVVFLDGDMEVVPEFLAAHAAAHGVPDEVVLGEIRTAPGIPRNGWVEYVDSRGVAKVAPGGEIPPRYFLTGNCSVAAPLLARAGGFDEDFDEYGGEDTEMGYRLAAHGGRFRRAPGAVSYHLDLASPSATALRLRRYGERMLPLLVRKAPRAREELHLDLAEPIRTEDGLLRLARKLAVAIACRRLFWGTAAALAGALPRGVRWDPLYDFLRAGAYLDGYRRALRRNA